MSELLLPVTINGLKEEIRFSNYPLINKRKIYEIELLRGRDSQGRISDTFEYPEENSIEWSLLEFVKTGETSFLKAHNLKVIENPGKEVISRNITLLDADNYHIYVVGSIGLIKFDKPNNTLTLEDPDLNETFHDYQTRHGRNPGGVIYISEKGVTNEKNIKPLGVSFITDGPTSLLKKIDKTQKVNDAGITTPQYLAAGRIKNLGNGEWGFSIYKTTIQPDYLNNLKLYLDSDINLKETFLQYLGEKYKTLNRLHEDVNCSHGQPTIENAGGIIVLNKDLNGRGSCILKDMDTLKPIPKSTKKTIIEGPCPQRIGINIKKSPHVAAKSYDLQLALTQELNILLIASKPLPNINVKLQFVQHQFTRMLKVICKGYGINKDNEVPQIAHFCFQHLINAINKGIPFDAFNEVLGGLAANSIFGLSAKYQDQIEVIPEA